MSRLTSEERRRVYLAQERARAATLARLNAPRTFAVDSGPDEPRRRLLFGAVLMAALLVGGVLASQTLEFHPPASWVEVLVPRL